MASDHAKLAPLAVLLHRLRGDAAPLTDETLSRTISFARIVLMVGLVCLHYGQFPNSAASPFDGIDGAEHPVATFVNSFMLFFFFSTVPVLSMVSGWLYFGFAQSQAASALVERIRRRVRSLYLPLVFWNVLYLLVAVVLYQLAPGYPVLDNLNIQLDSASWRDYVNAMSGLTRHPIAFQFWFVRDLLVTVFISPLLWLLLRRAPYVGMAVLGAVWLAGHDLWIFFRTDVLFFFYLGALLRTRRAALHVGRSATTALLLLYVLLVALRALAPLALDFEAGRPGWLEAATRAMRLVGVAACWGLCQQLVGTRAGQATSRYGGLAFFLFATHFPLIQVVKQWFWLWLPARTDLWMLLHYVLSVAVTVSISLSVALFLARFVPGAFALMNGGRLVPVGGAAIPRRVAPVA